MLSVLDLFSGIGGFSAGLESTGGFRTVAFCEVDPYATAILKRHWPDVPVFPDIRGFGRSALDDAGIGRVDVVCGGFPCQDISVAGRGAGLGGERSGLWFEMHRVIAETRPRFVVIENVSVLRSRGLETVLGGLAALGYDAEWHCIPAAAVGAPHRRDRVWILAYARGAGRRQELRGAHENEGPHGPEYVLVLGGHGAERDMAYADRARLAQREGERSDARQKLTAIERTDWWVAEPDVGRVANGVPRRVDRLRCLGNAVVPQIPEMIGRAILSGLA